MDDVHLERDEYVRLAEQASEYEAAGRYDIALKLLQTIIKSDVTQLDKSMMALNMALIYDKLNYLKKADAWFAKAISQYGHPESERTILFQMTDYFDRHGRDREAIQAQQRVLACTPEQSERVIACINLGAMFDKIGDEAEAYRWYEKAVSYDDPKHHHLALSRKADYLARRGRYEESAATYEQLLARTVSPDERQQVERKVKLLRAPYPPVR